jgi:hypothetical protein
MSKKKKEPKPRMKMPPPSQTHKDLKKELERARHKGRINIDKDGEITII